MAQAMADFMEADSKTDESKKLVRSHVAVNSGDVLFDDDT